MPRHSLTPSQRQPGLVATPLHAYVKTPERGKTKTVIFDTIADRLSRGAETAANTVSEAFFEPVVRLGVTGLSRSGKTVFITSLVANMLERGRMGGLEAARSGRIEAAYLQPQPDDTVPRFDFETHLADLTGPTPKWPASTRAVSELRLSFRVRPTGILGGVAGPRTVHLDIVDYPGEWLLDLGLLDKDFATWSAETLDRLEGRPQAEAFRVRLAGADPSSTLDETTARELHATFADYLRDIREAGFSDCTPGRFLLPGDLDGSPALTFAPLPGAAPSSRSSLWRQFERRYNAYRSKIVKPFFRDHFARIDRQVVLVDALSAIHNGPEALEELRRSMSETLAAFRPGRNAFLSQLLRGKRVERILFAATKADHLHHEQHPQMSAIVSALVAEARQRAEFAGAATQALTLAAFRATTEDTARHQGVTVGVVRGVLEETGKRAAFYPGPLPSDPAQLLSPAKNGAPHWLDADFAAMHFAPPKMELRPGDGPPHIRLDKAAEFLIGDRL